MSSTWSSFMSNSTSATSSPSSFPSSSSATAALVPPPLGGTNVAFPSSANQASSLSSFFSFTSNQPPANTLPGASAALGQMLNGLDDDINGAADDVSTVMRNPWDPFHCADWDQQTPSHTCIARIKRDILSVFRDPPPGMFIAPDADNITKIHALVVGPFETPYEGGFFYFLIRCPPDYPIRPPRCRLMTTGNNTVRFNPNLYRNGKVCLSILGTWSGPSWSPAQCISSLLISIQSLMSENPYHNEPGFENERSSGDSTRYNEIIKHETLRVAVCEMLENENSCPKQLREVLVKQFNEFYESYIDTCTENLNKDGQQMADPFGDRRGQFEYGAIMARLKKLRTKLAPSRAESNNASSSSASSSTTTLAATTASGTANGGNKHPQPEPAMRKLLEMYDTNPTPSATEDYGDIFDLDDADDDDDASSMGDSDVGEGDTAGGTGSGAAQEEKTGEQESAAASSSTSKMAM